MHNQISIPINPFSINSMFCKNRAFKTREYNEWSAQFFHRLATEENLKKFEELREYFDPQKHSYNVYLKFYYPKETLYTKKGALSARAHDISNIEKPLIDLIFLPQYFEKNPPYGCKNLNIDDKFISKMTSEKLAAEEHRIEITLSILPNNF